MPSPSSGLTALAEQLLPGLCREIGSTQDEVRKASERLGRIPPALLGNGSRLAVDKAIVALDTASDEIVSCLQYLYKQYPTDRVEE